MTPRRILTSPSGQIFIAIVAGVGAGYLAPAQAVELRFIGDYFVDLVRLLVGPVIFCTVTLGIAAMRGTGELRSTGGRALVYFEFVSLLSLLAGIAGAWVFQPGRGLHMSPASGTPPAAILSLGEALRLTLANSPALQLLIAGIVCGLILGRSDRAYLALTRRLRTVSRILFRAVSLVLKAAPLAAFAAIALTVGKYGLESLGPVLQLLGALYATTVIFVILVFGAVARCCGFSLWRLVVFIRDELMLVFGTAASVASVPPLIDKLVRLGCPPALVQVLLPTGFAFNLNGSSIYLTLTLLFLAQISHLTIPFDQLMYIVAVAMIASKGASGIAGSSFVILSSLTVLVPGIAPEGLVLAFSLERLLKCRSLANVIGNAVGCIAIVSWMGRLDRQQLRSMLYAR